MRNHRHRRALAAVLATTAVVALVAGCGTTPQAPEKSTLVLPVASASISLSPDMILNEGATNFPIAWSIYDPLWVQTGPASYSPWLAREFSYDDSRTALSVELVENARFSDGTPVDAEAVAFSLEQASQADPLFESADVTGEYSLVINLTEPNREFVEYVSIKPIAAKASWLDLETAAYAPIGSGPYLLDDSAVDSEYRFVRNPDYWNPDPFPFDTIEFKLMSDSTARLNALLSGQIDLGGMDLKVEDQAREAGMNIVSTVSSFVALSMGDRRGDILPAIGDVRVRQAINMAIDRESVAENLLSGHSDISNQIFAKGAPGYHADREGEYAYDPEAARELLAEAGYPNGFELEIPTYTPVTGFWEAYVLQALGDIGITVTYKLLTDGNWLTEFVSGKYPVLLHGASLSEANNMAEPIFFWNVWKNADPEVVELVDIFNRGSDEEAEAAIDELGELMLDQSWFAVLAKPTETIATGPEIEIKSEIWDSEIYPWMIVPTS